MASKRPRKLTSSQKPGTRAARSKRAPAATKRTTPVKKKPTTAKKAAAPKRVPSTGPAQAAKPAKRSKPVAAPLLVKKKAPARAELLAQARAAGISGRQKMTALQLRAALARLADQPAAAAASSDAGRRLAVAGTPPPPVAGLPWRYHVTELVAMPVDPLLVHVYWELLPEAVARVRAQLGAASDGASQVLRAYAVAEPPAHNGDDGWLVAHARHHFDLDVGGDVGSHYIHLWSPEQALIFEIGWRSRDGRFVAAARSNSVRTPRSASAEGGPERWMTVRHGRIVTTPPGAIPREPSAIDAADEPQGPAPWSATFPAHRGWGGQQ